MGKSWPPTVSVAAAARSTSFDPVSKKPEALKTPFEGVVAFGLKSTASEEERVHGGHDGARAGDHHVVEAEARRWPSRARARSSRPSNGASTSITPK